MLQNSESFLIKLNLFKSFEFQQQKLPHETGAFRVASRIIREAADSISSDQSVEKSPNFKGHCFGFSEITPL
ncbi:hypothetical protein CK516_24820 [Nostoc sp. 'Peltigera malacea cyanobiont' DB3992]|nr:hypothetical protein CK516_24820 [Nostoc sp. 'Peltigera malacea cyanobiont' DB3992]